jgi:deoxyuridine 5'-triphosphate nucleotidohydrolase
MKEKTDNEIMAEAKKVNFGTIEINPNKIELEVFKEHPDAIIPTCAYEESSAGFDFYSIEDIIIPAKGFAYVENGLRIVVPKGFYLQFQTRSSMGFIESLYAYEGLLDSHFMGNLKIKIYNFGNEDYKIKKGEKYCQGILRKKIEHSFKEITEQEFQEKEKNSRGYWGSTGK